MVSFDYDVVIIGSGFGGIALLFRHLSASRLVSIAQIEGRTRGAGSEFVLACDMRFAARKSAIFGHPEAGTGVGPGAGGMQHLARLMGRARALEVMLSAQDYDAELAERRLDQSRLAREGARQFRPVARSSDRQVPGRRCRHGQGPRQCDRARAGRGLPSGFRSLRRKARATRKPKGDSKPRSSAAFRPETRK